LDPKFQKTFS
jgi:hypothetical protein